MSAYLYQTEGTIARDRTILKRALAVSKAYGSPWIFGGGLNMPPEQLFATWGNIIELSDGFLFASSEPTHCPTKGISRTLDYVICSSSAEPWNDRATIEKGLMTSPHKALRIRPRTCPKNCLVEELSVPRTFPRALPTGCARRLVVPQWASERSGTDVVNKNSHDAD